MIRRVFEGSSTYGLVKYLYGEGRRNEHTDAHLVASWDGYLAGLEPAVSAGRCDIAPLCPGRHPHLGRPERLTVSSRGRIPGEVVNAYDAAH